MKKRIILFVSVVIVLLIVFPIHAVGVCNVPPPDELGPYHIGHYRVCFTVSPYGRYWATIRYPAIRDGWFAPKDDSGGPYPGIVVANGFAGS